MEVVGGKQVQSWTAKKGGPYTPLALQSPQREFQDVRSSDASVTPAIERVARSLADVWELA